MVRARRFARQFVVFLALALVALAPRLARADESAVEHVMETYDEDGDALVNATELSELFEALAARVGDGCGAAAAHDGHAHDASEEAMTNVTSADVIALYGGADGMLNETELTEVLTLAARCAAEVGCAFIASEAEATSRAGSDYVGLKMALLSAIIAQGIIGGMLPMYLLKALPKAQHALAYMNALSGGVFLSSGFVHLVPHALEAAAEARIGTEREYPFAMVMVVVGFLLAFFVERVLFHSHSHVIEPEEHIEHGHMHGHGHGHGDVETLDKIHQHAHEGSYHGHKVSILAQTRTALVFMTGVALHASLAGVSLGLQHKRSSIWAIFIAISSHKVAAAFSIACAFLRCGVTSARTLLAFMTVFSLITPIGILVGLASKSSEHPGVRAVLEGIAAGTFVYIGTVEVIGDEFETQTEACADEHGHNQVPTHTHVVHEAPMRRARLLKFASYVAGVLVITLSQLAIEHDDH